MFDFFAGRMPSLTKHQFQRTARWFVASWLATLPGLGVPAHSSGPPAGIVVEEVRRGGVADQAGLQPEDVLLSWRQDPVLSRAGSRPTSGDLASPFDMAQVLIEHVPRGRVALEGRRGLTRRSWFFPAGSPSALDDFKAAPVLRGDPLTLYQLGRQWVRAGELDQGREAWRRAADLERAAGNERVATWLLAEAARSLAKAERWPEADAIYGEIILPLEASPSGDPAAAQLLREWGALFQVRRDWDREADCYRRALAVDRRRSPESLAAAWSLIGLGYAASFSGGSQDDEAFIRQALKIRERRAPDSSDVAAAWLHWGHVVAQGRDFSRAEKLYQRAMAIQQKLPAGNLQLIEMFNALGYARYWQQDFATAKETWQRGLALADREAPEDFVLVGIAQGLGILAAQQGDWLEAGQLFRRAVAVCRRQAPSSLFEADALHDLGRFERQTQKREAGSEHLCQARDLVESWRRKFQGSEEIRARWGLFFASFYRDCAESLVEIDHPERAFQAVEMGRARAFLNLLTERRLRLGQLSPGRAAEWRALNAEYDRVEAAVTRLGARKSGDPRAVWSLQGRLREIRRRKDRLLQEDHPFTGLQYPEPLSLAEARRQLDPGTVALSYSVGSEKTLLFVLTAPDAPAPGWQVYSLDLGAAALEKRVAAFRDVMVNDSTNRDELAWQAKALYDLLVRPAEPLLAAGERILISPDGPLHTLPFAALIRQGKYLAEWKPIHFTLSLTTYAEMRKARRPPTDRSAMKLVAFGDPSYRRPKRAAVLAADPLSREVVRRGLAPLPASRREVEEVASLFSVARVFLGDQVTEERVKGAVRDATLVHFAVHGLLNERTPLNSALALSLPQEPDRERDNGLLQSWEIMEELALDADLVTLSACDTALGREVGGEGLIGLVRAFQYAGSRSIVASLWGSLRPLDRRLHEEFLPRARSGQAQG